MAVITYNGYPFPDYANVTIGMEMVYDEAGRTVVYNRYKIVVQAIITAEGNDPSCGANFRRARQLLTKAGAQLIIDQLGFSPGTLTINPGSGGVRDVEFGPKPRILNWNPVGATNAVEIHWECDTCIPTCEGNGGVRFDGIAAVNYEVSFQIDAMGFTTRTVNGYIEIAMTRLGRQLPDNADAYREFVNIPKPIDYRRESNWQISPDKRRVNFSIVDSQIRSPNAFAPGVINIEAEHEASYTIRNRASIPATISARIELAPNIYRGFAYEVFRQIVNARLAFASPRSVFFEALTARESLYGYSISLQLSYRIMTAIGVQDMFAASGLFTDLSKDWQSWSASTAAVIQTPRGISNLRNTASDDQIVDLCAEAFLSASSPEYNVVTPPPTTYTKFCNPKPYPDKSWLRFEGTLIVVDKHDAVQQISMGPDDLKKNPFNSANPTASIGETDAAKNIERLIESAPPSTIFEWRGVAERVGYEIQMPDMLTFGGSVLYKCGKQAFAHQYLGPLFCQPVYRAAWAIQYAVSTRPPTVSADEADPVNSPTATGTPSVPIP